MFRRWAAIGFLFILVCIVGVAASNAGSVEAARWVYVAHNCAEWEPIAHEDRTIAILETLGVHRGKALYCGIDQSDTFAKAETWEAGKDRNQRDDTVYWGENGNFFGFTACQEGWLTEGESGLTGCGIHSIFEFPRERVRDRDSGRKLFLRYGRTYHSGAAGGKYATAQQRTRSGGTISGNTFIWTKWARGENYGPTSGLTQGQRTVRAKQTAKEAFLSIPDATPEGMRELALSGLDRTYPEYSAFAAKTYIGADAECRELGYQRARSVTTEWQTDPATEYPTGPNAWLRQRPSAEGQETQYEYRRRLYYEATCWKP